MQIGCDPKSDSTKELMRGVKIPTVLDQIKKNGKEVALRDIVFEGYNGVLCVEAGGPTPGIGCAGRGIITAFEKLQELGALIAKVLGYVPQVHIPTFAYSIRDYVVMGRAPHMGLLNVPREAEYEKVDTVLEQMGIEHLADKLYTQISGGERQQVQIARVLVQESEIILLDEPTNHLDYGNQFKILQIISDLAKKGLTILMTTHMPDHAILLGGKVGILDREGHMIVGAAETIISEESLKNIYNTQLHLIYIEQIKRMTCVAGNIK